MMAVNTMLRQKKLDYLYPRNNFTARTTSCGVTVSPG